MNKERRELITKAEALISEAHAILTEVRDDEQSAFDNMPESLQGSERGTTMESRIDLMSEAIDALEEHSNNFDEMRGDNG